jgi:hypothetical protein
VAGIVTALSTIDLIGVWHLPWFNDRLNTLILLSVGVVLLTTLVERITVLRKVETDVSFLAASQRFGARYLEDSEAVLRGLHVLVGTATEKILASGGKSTAIPYLERISRKVKDDDLEYRRLLAGDHITHELHTHLGALIGLPTASVAWNYSEKYGNMTISERGVIIAIPTPNPRRFRGLALNGFDYVAQFSDVFWGAFNQGITLRTTRSLEILCEQCGTTTARNKTQLAAALREAEELFSPPASEESA